MGLSVDFENGEIPIGHMHEPKISHVKFTPVYI